MSSDSISTVMKKEIDKIMEAAEGSPPFLYSIDVEFYNEDGYKVSGNGVRLQKLTVIQDMLDEGVKNPGMYTDRIMMSLEVPLEYLLDIMDHAQGLRANLKFKYLYDENEQGMDTVELDRMVFIHNLKKFHQDFTAHETLAAEDTGGNLYPITMDLVDMTLYSKRKIETSFILKDATVADAIRMFCHKVGFNKIHLVEPDNERVYEHLIVPPMKSLATFFEYLQTAPGYGIYAQGCTYYYTEGVLYIYPQYDTSPEVGFVTHLYNVGKVDLTGIEVAHRIDENKDIHIAIPDEVQFENLVQAGVENERTGRVMVATTDIIDGWHTVKPDGTLVIDSDNYRVLRQDMSLGIANEDLVKSGTVKPTMGNPYAEASKVASSYRNRMAFTWKNAMFMVFRPSFPFIFHHDDFLAPSATDEDLIVMSSVNGMCEKVVYAMERVSHDTNPIFHCTCRLQLAVDPENS